MTAMASMQACRPFAIGRLAVNSVVPKSHLDARGRRLRRLLLRPSGYGRADHDRGTRPRPTGVLGEAERQLFFKSQGSPEFSAVQTRRKSQDNDTLAGMRARSLALLSAVALFGTTGCPNKESMGIGAMGLLGPGIINDPKNKSLRFDLLKFGLDQFCREMRERGAPLKLRDGEPVLGRFFANGCNSQVIDEESRQSFVVQYSGTGYAWTNITQRLGFESTGLVEYAPDFQLQD